MGLEIRKGRDGKPRRHWYGRYDVAGKATVVNLGVPIRGTIPQSLLDLGGADFEASRARAESKLAEARAEAQELGNADHLIKRLIKSKTGRGVKYMKLCDMAAFWRNLPRESKPKAAGLAWSDTVFGRFADFAGVQYVHEVKAETAVAYVETLRAAYSRKTARDAVKLLRSGFGRALPSGCVNPFAGFISRRGGDEESEGDTVHRRPFTADELQRLFDAARADAFLFPLVVTAACTGLRRADACSLKWGAVDLRAGAVNVKTSKTGAGVQIPIFKPLREVLETALACREAGAVYVWPEAAAMMQANPGGLTWRFKKLVCTIVSEPAEDAPEAGQDGDGRDGLAAHLGAVCKAVSGTVEGVKAARIIGNLKRYAAGAGIRAIEKATGQSRTGISADLHAAENAAGRRFMPSVGFKGHAGGEGVKAQVARLTRSEGATGRARRASVLDWHALRVTWVTLALSAGVPIELARLVTGHKTVEVVLKHYFKPGAELLRTVLGDKLPSVLIGGTPAAPAAPDPLAGLAAAVQSLSQADRARLAKLLNTKGAK